MTGLLFLSLVVTQPGDLARPRVANQRIILRTVAGDIVLALYPDVAPRHVAQLLKLADLGVYDTTHFFRVEPGFVVQTSQAADRRVPLTSAQKEAIRALPAEFSAIPHRRGVLSMAHADGDPNSAETSFSILLGAAPKLDREYTVFGHVERGMDVVDKLAQAPRGRDGELVVRLEIHRAEVVAGERLKETELAPARDVVPAQTGLAVIATGIALMIAVAVANNFLVRTRWARYAPSLNLFIPLVGTFLLLVILTPLSLSIQVLAVALFFGMLALFKVMSGFERPG